MKSKPTKEIVADRNLVAYCGLYCGACRSFLTGRCPGCKENIKASWCKVRKCCIENQYLSCADCKIISFHECRKYHNFMAKLFGLVFNSDRSACILKIKDIGYDAFATEMTALKRQSIKRK